ncbi:hypothetical protein BN9982_600004 [Mycobacterium tuberculosis]|nr:hypothetical protein BN9982_600004 [Mycobacterium tuberculosis]
MVGLRIRCGGQWVAAMRYSGGAPWRNVSSCAPVAQGIERLPPEQKAAGSNPAGGTRVDLASRMATTM